MSNILTRKEGLVRLELIFREQFLNDSLTVEESSSPETIDEWDSIAQIGLLLTVESNFGVKFSTEEMASVSTVGEILDALTAKGSIKAI